MPDPTLNRRNPLTSRRLDQNYPRPETAGVTYYQYRYYDPLTGRWPSRDPIGETGNSTWFDDYETYQMLDTELLDLTVKHASNAVNINIIEKVRAVLLTSLHEPTDLIGSFSLYTFVENNPNYEFDFLGLESRGNQGSDEFKNWTKEELEKKYKELGKAKSTKEEKALRQRLKKEQKARGTRPSRNSKGGGGRFGIIFFFFDLLDFMENDGKLPDSDGDGRPDVLDPAPDDPCEDGLFVKL